MHRQHCSRCHQLGHKAPTCEHRRNPEFRMTASGVRYPLRGTDGPGGKYDPAKTTDKPKKAKADRTAALRKARGERLEKRSGAPATRKIETEKGYATIIRDAETAPLSKLPGGILALRNRGRHDIANRVEAIYERRQRAGYNPIRGLAKSDLERMIRKYGRATLDNKYGKANVDQVLSGR